MNKNTWLSIAFFCIAIVSLFTGTAFSAEALLTLDTQTGLMRTDFGSGTYYAFTMVWGGDVWYNGTKVGDFTTTLTKTTYTGYNGTIFNYDIIMPGAGPIAEFFSVRANHISTGAGSAVGTIYAASPAWNTLIGLPVAIDGEIMRITY